MTATPRFEPWKGRRYGLESRFGVPVLVLGHSHTPGPWNPKDIRLATVSAIDWHRNDPPPGRRGNFFPGVARILQRVAGYEGSDIWDDVAFCNYFQDLLSPSQRPGADQWCAAEAPLRWVLERYEPKVFVVFGKVLRGHIEKTEPLVGTMEVVWARHPRNPGPKATTDELVRCLAEAVRGCQASPRPGRGRSGAREATARR